MARELGETGSSFATFIVFVVVAAMLYLGRDIFVPLALATLFSFALVPPMMWLRRYIGRAAAAILLVALSFTVIVGFGTVVAGQFATLAEKLPTYQFNLKTKLHDLAQSAGSDGVVARAASMLMSLREEVEKTTEGATPAPAPVPKAAAPDEPEPELAPVPVVVRSAPMGPIQLIRSIAGPLLAPLAMTGLVALLVIFILLNREQLRDRFIRLAGARNLGRTTEAMDEAASRVSRYLLMQLVVNVTYGIPIGVGLYLIGVPNAVLWSGLAVVLRFIPYLGPWIAAAFPLVLAIAVAPGWDLFFWTAGLFVVVELITGNFIEPFLFRSSTGLSSIAIILAAVFWTWLWGFVGLLLAIPLTVCLVVVGRHVPRLAFLEILLGDTPVLTPAQRFYQRLLAADPDEATEQAEAALAEQPVGAFYDEVVIPALALGELDRARGALEPERMAVLTESASTVLENLEDQDFTPASPGEGEAASSIAAPDVLLRKAAVLCVAGGRELDRVAASFLADLLQRDGFAPRIVQLGRGMAMHDGIEAEVDVICLSFITASATPQARYIVRRLRRRRLGAKIVAGFWSQAQPAARDSDGGPLATTGADAVVTSLRQAVDEVKKALPAASVAPAARPAPNATSFDLVPVPAGGE